MTSREFRKKVVEISREELLTKMEQLLSEHGLDNVKVNGFEVSPKFLLTDKAECEAAGREWICRTTNGVTRCRCQ
nr:hypothetical protein [uncultured Allomuricauda sp.]